MNKNNWCFILFLLLLVSGCKNSPKQIPVTVPAPPVKPVAVIIQPFNGMSQDEITYLHHALYKVYPLITVNNKIPLRNNALNALGYRYRGDSLLKFLGKLSSGNEKIIGLTHRDISVSMPGKPDWGVMGLSASPGNACVISYFRLAPQNRMEQFFKVAIHELGHNNGLPHCPVKTCYMRDAAGGNPINEEKDFCPSCKAFLKARFWTL